MKLNEITGSEFLRLHGQRLGFAFLLLAGGAAVPACADKVTHASMSCPCAGSNVCCSSGVCAKDEASCGQATLALAQESAGTWSGYFENFTLTSGSDSLKITLGVSGTTTTGQVVVGGGSPPPPPTDTTTPWPPGSGDGGFWSNSEYIEGYVYQAQDIRWESRRLRFRVALADAWQPFCDLYLPQTVGGQTFICPQNGGGRTPAGCYIEPGQIPIDCEVIDRCFGSGNPCSCDATTCTSRAGELMFDVALRGDNGDGSTTGSISTNVRLSRQ